MYSRVPFQPTGTNIVTNTAPTPGVRMRVVRSNGETANMVGLGEDLQLRIEIDQESAFGLFARKLEARTDNGELMNLVDDSGCPVNELIFPALQLEDTSRALYTDFKAFRFPSTPIVNFIATVQFCQDICEPVCAHFHILFSLSFYFMLKPRQSKSYRTLAEHRCTSVSQKDENSTINTSLEQFMTLISTCCCVIV